MATARRFITYSGSEEWIKQTLSRSLLPEDGVIIFKNGAQISITTIKDPPHCSPKVSSVLPADAEGMYIKFKENKSG